MSPVDYTHRPSGGPPEQPSAFLWRLTAPRSSRTPADHLHPAPAAPPPPTPTPTPPPTPTRVAAAPSKPATPPKPAAPAPAAPSSLDLSGPAPVPAHSAPSNPGRARRQLRTTLDEEHPVTTWSPEHRGSGAMTVTLRWESLRTAAGLPRPSDLQLGCLWQAMDRSQGVVQSLSDSHSAPGEAGPRQVLRLGRRDEREGQVLFVDLRTLPTFKRFFVFAYGTHGTPEWAALRPALTVAVPSGRELSMRPGLEDEQMALCVLASFHVVGEDLVIRREDDAAAASQRSAGEAFGWSLDWNPDGRTLRPAW